MADTCTIQDKTGDGKNGVVACRDCQDTGSWRSERQSLQDHMMSCFGWYPWECRKCRTRFYARRRN